MTTSGGRVRQFTMLLLAAVGCARPVPPAATATPPTPAASRFDPATAGGIRGRVMWAGAVPAVPDIPAAIPDGTGFRFSAKPNPFAPAVRDGGLAGAMVSLAGVDAGRSKQWPFPPAAVEQLGHELKVRQGGATAAVGIARIGDPVTVVSRDPGPTTVRLRGAAFVTLPFPSPDLPTVRRFNAPGVVEVSSGAMLAWAACDLVVSDHPYHAVTDAGGRFELAGVPAGAYRLTCRVRDWREVGHDRDPETGLIARRRFAPPVELTAAVRVPVGEAAEHLFTVDAGVFGRSPQR